MPAERLYGVLLVAGGFTHQENYGPGFAADPRCRVVGVTDEAGVEARRAALNRRLAEEMRVPLLEDLEAALRRPDVHIASVCVEPERQGRVGVRCARAGKHLYMDKPVAATVEDARRVAAAVREAGVRSQMFSHVNLPYARRARALLASGAVGELRAIHCDVLFAKGWPANVPRAPRAETYPPTGFLFPDAKRELFNIAVYPLAFLRWLTGREFTAVRAVTANYFFEEHLRRGCEDFGMMALEMEGQLTATVVAGRTGWMSHVGPGHALVRLFGTRGSATIDPFRPRAEITCDAPQWQRPPRDPEDPMGFWRSTQQKAGVAPRPEWLVMDSLPARSDQSLFVDAIEQGREAEVTLRDGAQVVAALHAAYASAALGRRVLL